MNKMIYYVIEIYGLIGWERYREFSANDYDLAVAYLKAFRDKDKKSRFRLVGVFNV